MENARIHERIKNLYLIPQMTWTEETVQYSHFIIFICLINTVTKRVSEALIHNIFVKI
jgi:hypothetical protein